MTFLQDFEPLFQSSTQGYGAQIECKSKASLRQFKDLLTAKVKPKKVFKGESGHC